ncbi:MAG: hydrogenase expression/formation protein HypE [Euryarchaeota archaeon RBG_16_62_10]|nr:MAG: hydrogenase expression/formation protein HypE [Euryarchaeota archaeon RBG_16_62_10]
MSKITMSHGAGGERMQEFIREFVLKELDHDFGEIPLAALDDAAIVDGIAFTTDSYTVKPLFFPGGDIGTLAVAGTVNDLAVMGAEPRALSCAMIIQEGFPSDDLHRIMRSMNETAKRADVRVVTGDTKVVEKAAADGLFVNTSGIGRRSPFLDHNMKAIRDSRPFKWDWPNDSAIVAGDVLIASGPIGNHGVALLSFREGYGFETEVRSDAAPLNHMIAGGLKAGGITAMKDPTRGGVANLLNEWSDKSKVGIRIKEEDLPIDEAVLSACEMLGIDPLEIGNEGKVVIAVVPECAEKVLRAIRSKPEGKRARIIGEATKEVRGVMMETHTGGKRVIEPPIGDPVPRIC